MRPNKTKADREQARRLWRVAAHFALLMVAIAETHAAEPEPAPPPPAILPYEIPTMRGDRRDFHHTPPIKLAPVIDADAVFKMVVNCFPERPKWGIEVKAVTGARYAEQGSG